MTETTVALTGGCLCGAVRYRYDGELGGAYGAVTQCHCAQCRKAQGGPVSVAPGSTDAFEVTRGRSQIREYQSSPGKCRAFCALCGSPLYSRRREFPEILRLRLGSIDNPPETLRIEAHIFCADRASWDHDAESKSYPGQEPAR